MPSITKRSPFSPFAPLDEADGMSQMLRRMFNDQGGSMNRSMLWSPSVEVAETNDALVMTAELPGMAEEDVTVSIENNVLTIAGEKKAEREVREDDERFLLTERFYGAFQRAFTLPRTIDADAINADFDKGVLTVTLPKTPQAKGRVISVKSKAK